MPSYKVLPGLPSSGLPAVPFPASFGKLGREGFVVEIGSSPAVRWVGNFARGLSNFSGVYDHPDGRHLLVISGGQGYVINPATQALAGEPGGAIIGVSEVRTPPSLLIDHQGIQFERIGAEGRMWQTRRLSWDGFRDVTITADRILGLGWHAPTDTWQPFEVDLGTGRTLKSVYEGPDLTEGEEVRDPGGAAA